MPDATPPVTVAMSVYNNAPTLSAAIESILAQRFADFEFLIVDDGSTDGSGAIIDDYAARDPRVRPLHQPNRGLVASLNRAIEQARAPLIARMDGDDIALPDRFGAQVAYLADNARVGVLGTGVYCIDAEGRAHPTRRLDYPTTDAGFRAALLGKPLICHPSVMMRTELVRAAGGYRAAYRHCEDYDLWLRLADRTQILSLPDRLLQYRSYPGQVSTRHLLEMLTGAAIARAAHRARAETGRDPTQGLSALPPIESLDALFDRAGVADCVRGEVVSGLLYDTGTLSGTGLPMLRQHIAALRATGRRPPSALWRAVARLARHGRLRAAGQTFAALVGA